MRAAVFNEMGQIAVVDRKQLEPRPGWVTLAVTSTGICGSDLNLLLDHKGSAKGVQPGHEVAAIVDAVGDGVTIPTGTHVCLEPLIGCGECGHCKVGMHNLCAQMRLYGFSRPGGMAEFMSVPADALYRMPDTLPAHVIAMTEPMAVCVRGVRLGALQLGERVAILGGGSIGLVSILAARAAGAGEILITARHPHQQELARALGADAVFPDGQALLDAVGPQHVDVVIETVGGVAGTLAESVHVARSGGRVVMLGVFDNEPALPAFEFMQKELVLKASHCYGRDCHHTDFGLATELVTRYARELDPLVTHRFKLDQVAEAFKTAADKSTRSIKVQVQP